MPSPSPPPAPPVLPISEHEDEIVAAVDANPVVVVIGETGSGKSTQLSQILHRRGYTRRGAIAVTQPRRVAAVSVSSDILLGLMKRLIKDRASDLKVLITSATLDGLKVSKFFSGCPVLNIPGTLFPVEKFYSTERPTNYIESSLRTAIVRNLFIIANRDIFLTNATGCFGMWHEYEWSLLSASTDGYPKVLDWGSQHRVDLPGTQLLVAPVVERLWSTDNDVDLALRVLEPVILYPASWSRLASLMDRDPPSTIQLPSLSNGYHTLSLNTEIDCGYMMIGSYHQFCNKSQSEKVDHYVSRTLPIYDGLEFHSSQDIHAKEPPGDVLIFMTGKVRVFAPAPPNCRRFIVATNVAETSLTVDGVVFVIDCGYVKQRQYNPSSGMYSLDVVQISRVQADQRAGRAGRTQPGKCYRLYPMSIYQKEFLEATVPEIQRTSLAGSVLYLKSLNLPDINILKFDFLDPPSRESLEDALRQLYLIDAIDENGQITDVGRIMAELPLEPSLSRTLIEANELGCLSQALTVAAILSAEITLRSTRSKGMEGKRKRHELPDGSGWGDHIQLLQIFESWDHTDYDPKWCSDHDLQVRGMKLSKDVRNQLCQIIQKIAKGPTDVHARKSRKSDPDYRKLRRALCVGYGNQLAERMLHHNGYHTVGYRTQLVQVHPSSVLEGDEYGKFPMYIVYHELISTTRPYMRNICAVEQAWVEPILKKLETLDVNRLSGGSSTLKDSEPLEDKQVKLPKKAMDVKQSEVDSKIQAARERYLARKGKK
ncbi:putative pre-mRNA-splicing factor ATP-dependent RNA helicase DEAH4 [Dichanthelium oligosanthes]|uniref:Putative pre-mRNA-splicing factor ATP-dependent RNA helicase DEAH4 n=1 Tax=Dichanthelium oligosanthes TaxID=888268 RepID=A0A1E5VZH7_9POAL|nr:putative pre-mRNA-splicing factor ATP-dependent RNA helicase DEAH4 [Dichanthelium oligosanthes]